MFSIRNCICNSCILQTDTVLLVTVSVGSASYNVNIVYTSTQNIISDRYIRTSIFRYSNRYIVQGILQLVVIGNRRLCYHKSPILFRTARNCYSRHIEHPYKIKYISTKSCEDISTTRHICTGEVYDKNNQRYCFLQPYPSDSIYIVKYPDYFRWKNIPHYISTLKISVYSKHPLLVSTLIITTSTRILHFSPEKIIINRQNPNIYEITYSINNTFQFSDRINISVYIRDVYGNFINKEILW